MEDASRRGMVRTEEIWRLTPREILCRVREEKAGRERGDLMAWIAARYIALSVHAPERLPDAPAFWKREESMTASQMKQSLRGFNASGEMKEASYDTGRAID